MIELGGVVGDIALVPFVVSLHAHDWLHSAACRPPLTCSVQYRAAGRVRDRAGRRGG